nr:alpha/beta hydrolase [Poseidonocella sp. HB161398]
MRHNLRDSPAQIGHTEYFTNRDGLRLAFRDDGPKDAPVLLCLAGLTRNLADFDFVARDFSDRARIVRLDTRGRGQSDWDPDYLNYNLIRESHDAIDLLDHLHIAKAAVLGTSRGGLIAMALAGGHKSRISGVCLNDIGPEIQAEGLAYIGQYLGNRPGLCSYEEAAERFGQNFGRTFPGVPTERWLLHAKRIYCDSPDGLDLRYDALLRRSIMEQSATDAIQDVWLLFKSMQGLPLALIRGENSNILSAATAGEMRRRRPDIIFGEVPDRGHVPFLDEPEAQAVISEFLERLP